MPHLKRPPDMRGVVGGGEIPRPTRPIYPTRPTDSTIFLPGDDFFLRHLARVLVHWLMREAAISENPPVLLGLEAATELEVIERLIGLLAGRGEVRDVGELRRAVLERQKLQPPLLGSGVALPHARTNAVGELVVAVGRCREPVPFGPERVPIRLVFLYGVPAHGISVYLDAVSRLTRVLRDPAALEAMLTTTEEAEFRRLLP